jgi:hypothetical protein
MLFLAVVMDLVFLAKISIKAYSWNRSLRSLLYRSGK